MNIYEDGGRERKKDRQRKEDKLKRTISQLALSLLLGSLLWLSPHLQ